jgi:lysophospholipase L1-like esterase
MLFDLPFDYVLAMAAWLVVLAASLPLLIVVRRRMRRRRPGMKPENGVAPHHLLWVNLGISVWIFLASLTVVELYFAVLYDASDAVNLTNVSKHWFKRHVEPGQKVLEFSDGRQTVYRDNREFSKTLAKGVRQICFVGDSITFGHGVANVTDRFSDRISASLDQRMPGRFVVSNLADAGRDLRWVESLLEEIIADQLHVNIVVYTLCLNDIETFDERTETWFAQAGTDRRHCFLRDDTYFLNLLYFRTVLARDGRESEYFSLLHKAYQSDAWDRMKRKFEEVRRLCADNAIDLRVAIFPFLHNLGPGYPFADAHRLIVAYCREAGLPVVDLRPVLEPHVGEGLVVSRFDSHPNERAHALAAEAIEHNLLGDLLARTQ